MEQKNLMEILLEVNNLPVSDLEVNGLEVNDIKNDLEVNNLPVSESNVIESIKKKNKFKVIESIKNKFKLIISNEEDDTKRKAIEFAYQSWEKDDFNIDHFFELKIYPSGTSKPSICDYTLLHLAATCNLQNVARALINAGANIELLDLRGNAPLHSAVIANREEVVGILAKAKVDVLGGFDKSTTPLHLAAEHERVHINIVKTLLAEGAEVNALGVYKRTPLHLAAKKGRKEVVEALIKAKADINARDDDGNTPLHLAYFYNRTEVVKYLESQGADASLKNDKGWVPSDYLNRGIPKLLKEAKEETLKSVKFGGIFSAGSGTVIALLLGMSLIGIYGSTIALPIAVIILIPTVIGLGIGFYAYRSHSSNEIKGENVDRYAPRGEQILSTEIEIKGENVEQYVLRGEQNASRREEIMI